MRRLLHCTMNLRIMFKVQVIDMPLVIYKMYKNGKDTLTNTQEIQTNVTANVHVVEQTRTYAFINMHLLCP